MQKQKQKNKITIKKFAGRYIFLVSACIFEVLYERKIIMLGTGSAMVTDCYNTCFLLKSENDCLLVDAGGGNGILSAIKKSGIAWNSIKTMFITHSHTDHILGAVWVIRQISALMNSGKYDGNFNIYCHDECVDSITAICNHTLAPKFLKISIQKFSSMK